MHFTYTTVEAIINKYMRDKRALQLLYPLDFYDAVEWIGEALDAIEAPRIFPEKVSDGNETLNHECPIKVETYRGTLPCDIYYIQQVVGVIGQERVPMRRTTDTMHMSYMCSDMSPSLDTYNAVHTYKANDKYIFTSFKEGTVEISYRAFPTDSNGYPLVPNTRRVMEACSCYIAAKISEILIDLNKISSFSFNTHQSNWSFYVQSAETELRTPDYDEAMTWKNIMTKLKTDLFEPERQFRTAGNHESRFNNSRGGGGLRGSTNII